MDQIIPVRVIKRKTKISISRILVAVWLVLVGGLGYQWLLNWTDPTFCGNPPIQGCEARIDLERRLEYSKQYEYNEVPTGSDPRIDGTTTENYGDKGQLRECDRDIC